MSFKTSNPKQYTNREEWVVHIRQNLELLSEIEQIDLKTTHSVCICEVPESLCCSKREAFIPQFVGLGPYHYLRDKLIMTEEKKLSAAKRVLKYLHPNNMELFEQRISNIGDVLSFYHPDVKSVYNSFTLSYVLTVDSLFLLGFLKLLNGPQPDVGFSFFLTGNIGVPMFHPDCGELTKNALIREVFKLENQIPFEVLKHVSGVNDNETQSDGQGDKDLGSNLVNICKQLCPLVDALDLSENPILGSYHHLLDLMYHLMIEPDNQPELQSQQNESASDQSQQQNESVSDESQQQNGSVPDGSHPRDQQDPEPDQLPQPSRRTCRSICWDILVFLGLICWNILVFLAVICVILVIIVKLILNLFLWVICYIFSKVRWVLYSVFRLVGRLLNLLSGLLKKWMKYVKPALHWTDRTLCTIEKKVDHPLLKSLRQGVQYLISVVDADSADSDEGVDRTVMIPSVVELHEAGFQFSPREKKGISVDFEADNCVLYLPPIKLDANSEVIIRNLVAYETLIKSKQPLKFTKYVEIMRAVIDTPEDVKLLVDNAIIKSELKNEAIADLFNGMSKSIRPTKTAILDKKLEQINTRYYRNVKQNRMKSQCTSGKFLTAIGGIVFLVFSGLQTYCSIYNCSASRSSTFAQDGNYLVSSV